jgi:hypothetical protein
LNVSVRLTVFLDAQWFSVRYFGTFEIIPEGSIISIRNFGSFVGENKLGYFSG